MSSTAPMTSIHPIEHAVHRIGLGLIRWSLARAERRDHVLTARTATASVELRRAALRSAFDAEQDRQRREAVWSARAAAVSRFR